MKRFLKYTVLVFAHFIPSFSYAVTALIYVDVNSSGEGDIDNTGSVSGTSDGVAASDTGDESVDIAITPSMSITKVATSDANVCVGQTITYEYTVTNDGNITIDGVNLADVHTDIGSVSTPFNETLVTDTAPTGDSTDTSTNGNWEVLAPSDTIRFTGNYIVQQNDIDTQ